ncbi:hypothetical protein KNE206_31580 [Kitasatospora sp. NE20-6]
MRSRSRRGARETAEFLLADLDETLADYTDALTRGTASHGRSERSRTTARPVVHSNNNTTVAPGPLIPRPECVCAHNRATVRPPAGRIHRRPAPPTGAGATALEGGSPTPIPDRSCTFRPRRTPKADRDAAVESLDDAPGDADTGM